MIRPCDVCGKQYTAKRPQSRYCSETCRKRNQRAPVVKIASQPTQPAGLAAVTERQLAAAGRLDTVLGQQALALAARVASPHETGSSVASLSRELRAVMEAALDGVQQSADPLDELRALRERKRSAG